VNRKRKSLQDDPMKGRKRGFNAYSWPKPRRKWEFGFLAIRNGRRRCNQKKEMHENKISTWQNTCIMFDLNIVYRIWQTSDQGIE
jgi:hypothetical protein